MTAAADTVKLMKQQVGKAAADRVQSGTIVGLGTGSTTAYAIQFIGERLKSVLFAQRMEVMRDELVDMTCPHGNA